MLRKAHDELEKQVRERTAELLNINEELRSSYEQLRALAAHIQFIREEERARIAREIHDELGQALTALKIDLSWLGDQFTESRRSGDLSQTTGEAQPILAKIQSMFGLIDMTIQSVRRIATELRPGMLDDLGLVAAIEWQAQDFQRRTGIQCKLFIESEEDAVLDKELSTALFRIFQETLTNVARHAQATKVNITLTESTGTLRLEIEDNGKGITEEDISDPKSLGLLGTRERALLFGGDVNITGSPGKGTRISVSIPLAR